MTLFDSHCHVNEEKFDEDRDAVLAAVEAAAPRRGVRPPSR